jgi:hypothetical protein
MIPYSNVVDEENTNLSVRRVAFSEDLQGRKEYKNFIHSQIKERFPKDYICYREV